MIGRTIGRFHVVSKLGQGGLATVWMARDQLLGRTVALKVLDSKLADSPKVRRRFLHEAQAAAMLDHPGIVTVHDAGDSGGLAYIALSLVEGETLTERVARRLLPLQEAVRIVIAVAEALGHAHERGVIHRDVTGRNIMVAHDGRVVVLDFGLALAVWESRVTSSETAMGTAHYMAPEVIQGRQADARSDLYGLGVVLYEALTGTFPFGGDQPQAAFYAALNLVPVPPTRRRPEIPPGLERVVLKAIARDPEQRYQTAAGLLADLSALDPQEAPRPEDRTSLGAASRPGPGDGLPDLQVRAATESGKTSPRSSSRRDGDPWYLAVVPFETVGSSPDPEGACSALAGRLADTVSRALASARSVHVVQPVTARAPADPRDLARELGANVLLRGNVSRVGSQVRVSYSLLDPWRGVQVAGDVIDGSPFRIFDLEDEVSASVGRSLGLDHEASTASRVSRPPDPAANERYAQALAYLRRHDNEASLDGAINLLERLLASEGENAVYYAALARVFLYKYENTQERIWEARAASACHRANSLAGGTPEVAVAVGHLRLSAGQHDEAVREYERALSSPLRFDAMLGIARAHANAGRLAEAERICLEVVAVEPGDWRGYSLLGWIRYQGGRYEQALESWARAVELTPDNARGQRNMGSALYRLDRYEEAVAAFQESLAIRPNDEAYHNLGTALYYLERNDESISAFRRATELAPSNPLHWGNLGDACFWIPGHESEAERCLDRAIALMKEKLERNSSFVEGWTRLAGWLAARGLLQEAQEAIRTAMSLAPGDVRCRVQAGRICYQVGDRVQCLEWFRKAIEGGCAPGELMRSRELAPLRADPEFLRLLEEASSRSGHDAGKGEGGRR